MHDLVIAGGGPIGLAVALHATRAGLDVVVLEPRAGTIDKACGEGLMPGAVGALRRLHVQPRGRRLTGIRYLSDGAMAEAAFRHGTGLGVRRTELHDALAAAVAAAGVPVVNQAVRSVQLATDRVVVEQVECRHLIAADGLHSAVRRLVGLDRPVTTPRRFGQRRHVAAAPWSSFVEVHWARAGEAYVTPVSENEVGVAVLTQERRPWAELIQSFPELAERLADAPPTSEVRGAGPLRQRARRRVAGRVLLVGDASGYVDALTGEGIALGLAQAEAAVGAIVSGRPTSYEQMARRLAWRHELLTRALVASTRSAAVRDRLVPTAARLPAVFAAAVNQLARPG